MPVSLAPANTPVTILKITAEDKVRKHLLDLGITEGGKITLISSTANGVIVVVKEGRLCLDGALAKKILVG